MAVEVTAALDLQARLDGHAAYFDEKLAFIPTRAYMPGESDQQAFTKKGKNKGKGAAVERKKKKPKKKAAVVNKYKVRATLPELIDDGKLGTGIEIGEENLFGEDSGAVKKKKRSAPVEEQEEGEADALPPVVPFGATPGKPLNAQMSEIAEKLGFVPGSLAKTPAELKRRMALLRDWYKTKNNRPNETAADADEKKKHRKLQKQKTREARKAAKKEEGSSPAVAVAVADAEAGESPPATAAATADKSNAIEYGVFKFANGKSEPLYKERKRGRDEDLLRKAEAEKQRLQELAQTPEGAQVVKEKEWEKMMAKAEGEKIKDDPAMLKKTIKKKEKKKHKSQSEWAEKAKKQEEAKKAKQTDYLKRQDKNIARKKFGRKGAPVAGAGGSKAPSSRKQRAGFEGKIKVKKK